MTVRAPELQGIADSAVADVGCSTGAIAAHVPASKQAADLLRDEQGRLAALERLEILDSSPETPFEKIVELVCEVLNVPICAVSLIDQDRQWFKAYRGLGVSETAREISFCTHAIQQSEPYIVEDAAQTPLFANNPLVTGDPHIGSYAGAQLKTKDGFNIGTLCAIDTRPRVFSAIEIALLTKFASLVIDDIEMREIAACDTLTGALSRRTWLNCAMHELHRARRYKTPMALFMIDIDNFKHVNDRFGHTAGDAVIKAVAANVGTELRKSDWFGRYGGEEFVAALPGSSLANAVVVAERMRAAVATLRLPGLGDYRCTISIGVAGVEPQDSTIELALERADQALLHAKRAGRNQVKAATQPVGADRAVV